MGGISISVCIFYIMTPETCPGQKGGMLDLHFPLILISYISVVMLHILTILCYTNILCHSMPSPSLAIGSRQCSVTILLHSELVR